MIRLAFAFLLSLCVSAQAQLSGGVGGFPGPGFAPTATYQGLGDVSTGWRGYYSCAYVYSAAQASTSTNMCDLVAVTGGAAVCTLRGSSSGAVNLSAYCPGSLTPSAACAAASGGSCLVSKAYNQINPGTDDVVSGGTLSQNPALTFSGLNSLPGMVCSSGAASRLLSGNITQAQPISLATVAVRTTVSSGAFIGSNTGSTITGLQGGSSNAWSVLSGGTGPTQAATDSSYHAGQALLSGASSSITIDGAAPTGASAGTGGWAATPISLCRANGVSLPGTIMESAVVGSDKSADFSAINTNAHSRYAF